MQAYDTAQLIGVGLKATGGDLSRQAEFRAALRKPEFASLRGKFSMNTNQHPVQDLYLMRICLLYTSTGRAVLSMLNWMVRWYKPGQGDSAETIAAGYFDLLVGGMRCV